MPFFRFLSLFTVLALEAFFASQDARAQEHHATLHAHHKALAPAGIMGDHMHGAGEFMLSYGYMHMDMDGNRDGTNNLSATTIATTVPNRFFGMAGQPATLRVVPERMTMDMHMLGAMYAPTDNVTLMLMARYLEKEMDHTTFAGGAGTTVLGHFTTRSEGLGDTQATALVRLWDHGTQHLHAHLGLSLPTGSITETATVLTPMNMRPRMRMPYAMQLGTGTFDFLPGLTYTAAHGPWHWGAQYAGEVRLENENDEGYAWGDKHSLALWSGYQWAPWIGTTARLTGTTQDKIDGIDPNIVAPIQTADPDNYGGQTLTFSLGTTLTGQSGALKGHQLAFEATAPVYRHVNGPQLETDWAVTVGWRHAF
ncbi:MAG: transporter [Alphaproteobacteria bacterium]|nr:transporter [Alphaproteobacteria bacterium]